MSIGAYTSGMANRSLERGAYIFADVSATTVPASAQALGDLYARVMIARDSGARETAI